MGEAMAEEVKPGQLGPKKRFTKPQSIAVMVGGAVLLILPWFIPTEQGSTAQIVRTLVGAVGFCVLCAGAYYRP
jgi:hypothetical protein